jgi:hypothetical protein
LAAALAVRLYFFIGCDGSDDLDAVLSAQRLAAAVRGQMFSNFGNDASNMLDFRVSVVDFRLGLIVPIALTYALAGVSYAASFVYPLLTSLGSIVLAWYLGRTLFSAWAGWVAAIMVAFAPLEIIWASAIYPDVPLDLYQGLAVLLLIAGMRSESTGRRTALLLGCGLITWLAWMTKEVGMQIGMALALMALVEAVSRRPFWRYAWVAVGCGLGLLVEVVAYWAISGNPFLRWSVRASAQRDIALRASITGENSTYLDRLGVWVNKLVSWSGPLDVIFAVAVILALVYLVKGDRWRRLVALWFLVLASFFLLSITLTHSYQPRRLLVLSMPAALLVADCLVRLVTTRSRLIVVVLLVGLHAADSYASLTSEYAFSRSRQANARRCWEFMREHPEAGSFYTDYRTQFVLHFLNDLRFDSRVLGFPIYSSGPFKYTQDVRTALVDYCYSKHWITRQEQEEYCSRLRPPEPSAHPGSYVMLNWHYLRYLLEKRVQITLPKYVMQPPVEWHLVEVWRDPDRRDDLQIFQVADGPVWADADPGRGLNLGFKRKNGELLPDRWSLFSSAQGFAPYDVMSGDDSGRPTVRLKSDTGLSQYLFTGRKGFSVPPEPLGAPAAPVLRADSWYRLDLVGRVEPGQKLEFLVFLYDDQGKRKDVRLGALNAGRQMGRQTYFFRSESQPMRYRMAARLAGKGSAWIRDLRLSVQDAGVTEPRASTQASQSADE